MWQIKVGIIYGGWGAGGGWGSDNGILIVRMSDMKLLGNIPIYRLRIKHYEYIF